MSGYLRQPPIRRLRSLVFALRFDRVTSEKRRSTRRWDKPVPDLDQTVLLPDRRMLGYRDFGDPSGTPVLYQHGWPGSRLDIVALDSVAAGAGVRFICPDRPGFGLSTDDPARTLLDWPGDVAHLMDSLGIDRFAVLGFSGGGPSALATAYLLPQRVTAIAMVSAWGPMGRKELRRGEPWDDRIFLELGARAPWALPPFTGLIAFLTKHLSPTRLLKLVASSLSDSDNELLSTKPDLGPSLVRSGRESFRQRAGAAATDVRVTAQPWEFQPKAITVPVHFWHGSDDPSVPINISEVLSTEIIGATLHVYQDEGHLVMYGHTNEILDGLVG